MYRLVEVDVSSTRYSQAPVIAAPPTGEPDNSFVEFYKRYTKKMISSPAVPATSPTVVTPLPPPPTPPPIPAVEQSPTPQEPMDWVKLLSSNGKHYFYNTETGESTYRIPPGWITPSVPVEKSSSSVNQPLTPLPPLPPLPELTPPDDEKKESPVKATSPPHPPVMISTPTGVVSQKRRSIQADLEASANNENDAPEALESPALKKVKVEDNVEEKEEKEKEKEGVDMDIDEEKMEEKEEEEKKEEGEEKKKEEEGKEEEEDTRAIVDTANKYNVSVGSLEKCILVERPKLNDVLEGDIQQFRRSPLDQCEYERALSTTMMVARSNERDAAFEAAKADYHKQEAAILSDIRKSWQSPISKGLARSNRIEDVIDDNFTEKTDGDEQIDIVGED